MSHHPVAAEMREHKAISLLLPWYVNGTLSTFDRQRVESHLPHCADCRDDLELEKQIHAGVATEGVIEHIPAASLNRLHSRLDALEPDALSAVSELQKKGHRPSMAWLGLIAASIAGAVVTVGFYTVRGFHQASDVSSPAYFTVTDSEPRPSNEVIRAVFAPTMTVVELQAVLDEAQLNIVAGPTEAGVYSLAARSSRPVGLSLGLLRQHEAVRFAEITQEGPAKSKADNVP